MAVANLTADVQQINANIHQINADIQQIQGNIQQIQGDVAQLLQKAEELPILLINGQAGNTEALLNPTAMVNG